MDYCDAGERCPGAAKCLSYAEKDAKAGVVPARFFCEWDGLLFPIIDLPADPERIGNGELRDYLSAYFDDIEYLA